VVDRSTTSIARAFAFGPFRLFPAQQLLLEGETPVRIGSRALEILTALAEHPGELVSKKELMARVWPETFVSESNLKVHVAALRKTLGDGQAGRRYLANVPGRGYRFVAPVEPDETADLPAPQSPAGNPSSPAIARGDAITSLISHAEGRAPAVVASARPEAAEPATNLPQPVSELIGRDDTLLEIVRFVAVHRLVTLTGAGGIGKTRLALAAAHRLLPQFGDGAWLVELASLSDPSLIPAAVAATVGLNLGAGAITAERVANALSRKQLLLLLDNCEHLIDGVAMTAEALLRGNRSARIIATSREPLRTEGEQIYPVPPLDVPLADMDESTEPLRYGAVQLFLERAREAEPQFAPDERLLPTLAAICRRLDGIPLAIELAAARAAALGIQELAVRLDERFNLLTSGRRTAPPRHQTLGATLDWSHDLLPEPERLLLRRLGIFVGPFSVGAVCAVAAGAQAALAGTVDGLSSLVAKSLVVSDIRSDTARYRLLDTTRAYALRKLGESGEREQIARRHAEFYRELFERAEAEWQVRSTAEWLGEFGWRIDNVRAALDWAFSPDGDGMLGIALTSAAIPLWMHLSLLDECGTHVERALAVLAAAANEDPRREMKLRTALGVSLAYTGGAVSEIEALWARTLHLAQRLGDVDYQLCALFGLWGLKDREALALAQQFAIVAVTPADRLVGERMIGNSYHFLGDQIRARRQFERVIAEDVMSDAGLCIRLFHTDNRPWAQTFLARVLWLQGFPAQAADTAQGTIEQPRAASWARPLCQTLARAACPIALWTGDLDLAEHYIELLSDYSAKHGLTVWRAFGCAYEGVLSIQRGHLSDGIGLVRAGLDEIDRAFAGYRVLMFLGELAEALGRAGQIVEGLATINKAVACAEQTAEGWIVPELLRIKGELLLLNGGDEAAAGAGDHMRQALDLARRQGALSWELRAATSLARLLHDQGRPGDALRCLQPVYDRFTEGFDTADLNSARALLDNVGR
jgi:predicted ATPase/DNA-binding winged helix-turn-helix (wHTH) protein